MTLEQLVAKKLVGKAFYAHSVGEGYHYRGRIAGVALIEATAPGEAPSLRIALTGVETMTEDIERIWRYRWRPWVMPGDWRPYEDFAYMAPASYVYIDEAPGGLEVSFREAGVLYVAHTTDA